MALFLFQRRGDVDYDQYAAVLIRAKNEEEARKIASEKCEGGEDCMAWREDNWVSDAICTKLTASGDSGVIIQDFRAG